MRSVTTSSNDDPAASRHSFTAFSDASVWTSMSPLTIFPVTMSTGGVAATKTKPLALVTDEHGTPSARIIGDRTGTSMISFFTPDTPRIPIAKPSLGMCDESPARSQCRRILKALPQSSLLPLREKVDRRAAPRRMRGCSACEDPLIRLHFVQAPSPSRGEGRCGVDSLRTQPIDFLQSHQIIPPHFIPTPRTSRIIPTPPSREPGAHRVSGRVAALDRPC